MHEDEINAFNTILANITKELYKEFGPKDMSATLEVTLAFDEQQRVSAFRNPTINGESKMPSFEVTERINNISSKLLEFPEHFRLKECKFIVKPGGEMNIAPTYMV